ncbi:phage tail tube protein [Sphingobium scionense]|uniref:Putative secreted protein n=1 Tax=Sphingobium scionense TaxID=1404341 RepID=A0A7W6LRG4_9SPHN|nr:phage tail tube protein [Sphingobium scionense]MBB4147997.1 putative secreted protein [Sphingobium scionense]
MAYTDKLKSTRVYIAMGDGATPTEVFAPMCGINTKGFQQTRATNDTVDWDCADPDASPITVRDIGAKDWTITGSGLLHRSLLADLQAAFDSGNPTNFRFVFDEPTGSEVIDGFYAGPGIVTDFNITGNNGEYVNISITISGAGPVAFVTNP